jgi:hypothetical protein
MIQNFALHATRLLFSCVNGAAPVVSTAKTKQKQSELIEHGESPVFDIVDFPKEFHN